MTILLCLGLVSFGVCLGVLLMACAAAGHEGEPTFREADLSRRLAACERCLYESDHYAGKVAELKGQNDALASAYKTTLADWMRVRRWARAWRDCAEWHREAELIECGRDLYPGRKQYGKLELDNVRWSDAPCGHVYPQVDVGEYEIDSTVTLPPDAPPIVGSGPETVFRASESLGGKPMFRVTSQKEDQP